MDRRSKLARADADPRVGGIDASRKALVTLVAAACCGLATPARGADDNDATARLDALTARIAEQTRRLDALRKSIAEEQASLEGVRRALEAESIAQGRGPTVRTASAPAPVGQAPAAAPQPVVVAPIFEQPGVLTPRGRFAIEPSFQYSYSSSDRVALVGYTIIPSILVGLIDVREVKRNTFTGTLTARYGVTNRLELETRVPYVYRSDTGVGREFLQGSTANASVFDSSGHGIGDVEATARYQFNDGGADTPYWIGSLRFKSRTGRDPFQVETSHAVAGFRDDGVQTSLPTGSGFYGLQPAVTMLYPSDPAVFFGTVSYLHSFRRGHVSRNTDTGPEELGSINPGGIFGFNFGMGLALNDRSSFSIGYDQASVGRTKLNGQVVADSVRVQLGTLLLGYSLRLSAQRSISLSLGAGITRDTPDLTLTVRLPISF